MSRARYALTRSLRGRLKKPMGRFFTPEELTSPQFRKSFEDATLVITVGDRVTDTVHAIGRTPDVQVVDGRERREERREPDAPFKKLIEVSNPAGSLTSMAISAARRSFRERQRPVRILVKGEEDLMTIPALIYAPDGSVVFYGQPGKGVVMVTVDSSSRERARRVLSAMKTSG